MQTDNDRYLTNHAFTELLLHLDTALSSYRAFPHNIVQALRTIGKFSHHDRIHIVEIHNNLTYTITYEWGTQEVERTPEKRKHARIFYNLPLVTQLTTQNYMIIRDENPENTAIHTLLQEQNCQQMLLLPLYESGSQFAFIAFLQCRNSHEWTSGEIKMLSHISSFIGSRLSNYTLTQRLLSHLQKYHQKKVACSLQYHRLKHLHSALFSAWEKMKKNHPELSELTELENHMTTLNKICQSLVEK